MPSYSPYGVGPGIGNQGILGLIDKMKQSGSVPNTPPPGSVNPNIPGSSGIVPGASDWWNTFASSGNPVGIGGGNLATNLYSNLMPFIAGGTQQGYGQLMDILGRGGMVDPTMANRTVTGISRATSSAQRGLNANLASKGLQNSGLGMALNQAVGASGASRMADYRAQEAQAQDQRQRENMGLLVNMLVNPAMQGGNQYLGVQAANQQQAQQDRAANNAQNSEYLKTGLGILMGLGVL